MEEKFGEEYGSLKWVGQLYPLEGNIHRTRRYSCRKWKVGVGQEVKTGFWFCILKV